MWVYSRSLVGIPRRSYFTDQKENDLPLFPIFISDPPGNCHLNVQKLPKNLTFFSKKLPQIFNFFRFRTFQLSFFVLWVLSLSKIMKRKCQKTVFRSGHLGFFCSHLGLTMGNFKPCILFLIMIIYTNFDNSMIYISPERQSERKTGVQKKLFKFTEKS